LATKFSGGGSRITQREPPFLQNLSKFTPFASLYSDPAYGRAFTIIVLCVCVFYIRVLNLELRYKQSYVKYSNQASANNLMPTVVLSKVTQRWWKDENPTVGLSNKNNDSKCTAVGRVWIKWGKRGEFRQILKKIKDFISFQKVTLPVSKVRHLPHLPPLCYGHEMKSFIIINNIDTDSCGFPARLIKPICLNSPLLPHFIQTRPTAVHLQSLFCVCVCVLNTGFKSRIKI
jgi:hypothetical protein